MFTEKVDLRATRKTWLTFTQQGSVWIAGNIMQGHVLSKRRENMSSSSLDSLTVHSSTSSYSFVTVETLYRKNRKERKAH